MNIFEIASRKKFRFSSSVGDLMTEQLWDLPLTTKRGPDLDTVAKTVNNELKSISDESFVATRANPRKGELEIMLELVKHVIAVKQDDAARAVSAAHKADQRRKIMEALANAENAEMANLSREQLLAKLAELDDVA